MNAVGYTRVSGQSQTNGTGPDRQRATIEAYALKHDYNLNTIYDEAYTGTEADRPMLAKMIQDALGGECKTIIVERLDRLARDLSVQMHLLTHLTARGLTLIDATTGQDVTAAVQADPMMRAMIQIQGVFAELDKSLIVQKLKHARALVRERTGRCEGRKPFGARKGEQVTLARIVELRASGKGYKATARQLDAEHLSSRTGKPWTAASIQTILDRIKRVREKH